MDPIPSSLLLEPNLVRRYCPGSPHVPRLSIVIPVLADFQCLEETLVSVLENRPDRCQIVVVPNELYDDPYDLKDEVCFVQAPPGASLVTSANLGICASRAPIVHLLACGAVVSPAWAEAALARFDDPRVAAVAPLVLDRENPQRVLTMGVGYRSAGVARQVGEGILPAAAASQQDLLKGPTTLAAFYRKSALETIGQFAPEIGEGLAGLDLAMRLQRAGFRCALEPSCRVFAQAAPAAKGASFRSGIEAERFFWRWAPQHGWLRSLAGHSTLLAGECLQSLRRPATLLKLVGRLVGSLNTASQRRHWRGPQPTTAGLAPPHFSTASKRAKRLESVRVR